MLFTYNKNVNFGVLILPSFFGYDISVQKPREQVADAEALLEITNRLVSSVKTHNSEGITPSDFVTCLLSDFGQQSELGGSTGDSRNTIFWKDIGVAVSHVFRRCPGCSTM